MPRSRHGYEHPDLMPFVVDPDVNYAGLTGETSDTFRVRAFHYGSPMSCRSGPRNLVGWHESSYWTTDQAT